MTDDASAYVTALGHAVRPSDGVDFDYGKMFQEGLATKLQQAHAILAEIGRPSR